MACVRLAIVVVRIRRSDVRSRLHDELKDHHHSIRRAESDVYTREVRYLQRHQGIAKRERHLGSFPRC